MTVNLDIVIWPYVPDILQRFCSYFHYCRSLQLDDNPTYAYLKRIFWNFFILEGESCSGIGTSFMRLSLSFSSFSHANLEKLIIYIWTRAGCCNNLVRYMLEHFNCDSYSLILHKTKLCAAALAPFKAYEGNFQGAKTIPSSMRCSTC
ncbi:hypothetical protein MKW98_009194 [Papaver atlanticum]|uniref:Uncharacterized protein n=1 Tax=Papaver atlanticum TaxID=357466 RepID=A0AAD4XFP2_9MAGN|nr:hypothetical protein MKW98_009194 [Papaver atlanticum]